MTEIIPAILTNDVNDFRKKYAELFALSQHFNKLHIDFMDDTLVPGRTVMPADLSFLIASPFMLLAHLMTAEPQKYFNDLKMLAFYRVLIHYEAFIQDAEVNEAIEKAQQSGLKIGLVINPETSVDKIAAFLPKVEMIQLMGIHPGGQGREFMPETLDRIRQLKTLSRSVIIAVDGGIKVGVAKQCAQAGADILVAGSAILKAENEQTAIETLKEDVK